MAEKKKVKAAEEAVVEEMVEAEEELLFEDGPTMKEVEEWKKMYKQVYLTEFEDGEIVIFRVLTRKEFKDIMSLENADALYREERVCEKCVVWPSGYDFLSMSVGKAGAPSLISEQIMDKSGFSAVVNAVAL
jgi:hypothetical protein